MLGVGKGGPRPPEGAKFRTISGSESGVESLSAPETRCGSDTSSAVSWGGSEASAHHSEDETSDYPRSTPSPSTRNLNGLLSYLKPASPLNRTLSLDSLKSGGQAAPPRSTDSAPPAPQRPTRRSTLPPAGHASLHKVEVSLAKLPAWTLKAHLPDVSLSGGSESKRPGCPAAAETKCKKVKLEDSPASSHSFSPASSTLVLPGQEDEGGGLGAASVLGGGLDAASVQTKAEDMKLEIAKIDSILQGNILGLDKSKRKISDILVYSNHRIKDEQEADFKTEAVDRRHQNKTEDLPPDAAAAAAAPFEAAEVAREFVKCRWRGCGLDVEDLHLLEHLQVEHLTEGKGMKCLWVGCKVYGAESSARGWLKNHVTSHVGDKPFICILDSCRMKFKSQISLSRHVNSHFKPPATPGGSSGRGRSAPDTPIKFYIRKTRRKNRLRPNPLVNNIDIFDAGIMTGVKHGLSRFKRRPRASTDPNEVGFDSAGSSLVLTSEVLGRKLDEHGNISVLVQWNPTGFVANEWVPLAELKSRRKELISRLNPPARQAVEDHLFGKKTTSKSPRKTRPYLGPPRLT